MYIITVEKQCQKLAINPEHKKYIDLNLKQEISITTTALSTMTTCRWHPSQF